MSMRFALDTFSGKFIDGAVARENGLSEFDNPNRGRGSMARRHSHSWADGFNAPLEIRALAIAIKDGAVEKFSPEATEIVKTLEKSQYRHSDQDDQLLAKACAMARKLTPVQVYCDNRDGDDLDGNNATNNADNPKAVAHAKFVFGEGNPNANISALAQASAHKDVDDATAHASTLVRSYLRDARNDPDGLYGKMQYDLAVKKAGDWITNRTKEKSWLANCMLCGVSFSKPENPNKLDDHWCKLCQDKVERNHPNDPMYPIYARAKIVEQDTLDTLGTPENAVIALRMRIADRKKELADVTDCIALRNGFDAQLADVLAMHAIEERIG